MATRSHRDDDTIVGDLVAAGDTNPVLEPPHPNPHGYITDPAGVPLTQSDPAVELNVSMARQPDGAHCIRVVGPRVLTCAQAYQVAIDLTEASERGADIRQKGGFEQ